MAAETQQAAVPAKPPVWNDPRYRALFFQALVLLGVVGFGAYLVQNTLTNLETRGIASGFDFLERTAGFSIGETLIPYSEEHSYGRAFLVGLLNTFLVAATGVILATVIGFAVGIARLSSNWLLSKLAGVYIEVLRNIPILLQIFFWYFAVLRIVPSPRESLSAFDSFFLNKRGLYTPAPVFEPGFWLISTALLFAILAVIFLARWAHRRQELTGQQFPIF